MPHVRHYALDLVDDPAAIAAYEAWHAPGRVPRAIVEDIAAQGILDLQIFRTGNRLVMTLEVADDFPRPHLHAAEDDEWQARMWRYQQPLPHAAPGEKWVEMTRIFALEEHR